MRHGCGMDHGHRQQTDALIRLSVMSLLVFMYKLRISRRVSSLSHTLSEKYVLSHKYLNELTKLTFNCKASDFLFFFLTAFFRFSNFYLFLSVWRNCINYGVIVLFTSALVLNCICKCV